MTRSLVLFVIAFTGLGCGRIGFDRSKTTGTDASAAWDGGDAAAPATCGDGVRAETETDVDCGGPCPPCADGSMCQGNEDCSSFLCSSGVCQVTSSCSSYDSPIFCSGFEDPDMKEWTVPSPFVSRPVTLSSDTVRSGERSAHAVTKAYGGSNTERAYLEAEFDKVREGSIHFRAYFLVPSTTSVKHFDLLDVYEANTPLDMFDKPIQVGV
ncbi:MAG: hypothetical protein KC416_07725, partial [Myxococcales bacterium]|nr:hypothetical protein [Myxococcales bacterium]